jgi:hypothetical protein
MQGGPAIPQFAGRHRWWLTAVVIPALLCALAGRWLLFHLFGNGSYIPAGTTGYHVVEWWDRGNGRFLTAGLIAAAVALVRRRSPLLAVAAGMLAAALTLVFELVALLVFVSLNPGALD